MKALQLVSAGKLDLAIDVLGLNLRVFPEHAGSRNYLARLQVRWPDACGAWPKPVAGQRREKA